MSKNIFISHSWGHSNDYTNLVSLLERHGFQHSNYSVEKEVPLETTGTRRDLNEKLKAQIKPCSCLIVIGAVYATYSQAIKDEIQLAAELGKPIICVLPRGAERGSTIAQAWATKTVRWNGDSIISAIKEVTK